MLKFLRRKDSLLKKILIILFAFLLTLACIGIVFRYRTSHRMDELTAIIEYDNPEKKPITEALLLINESENHFQKAVAIHDRKAFFEYKKRLHLALDVIDSIVHTKPNLVGIKNGKMNDSLKRLFRVKEILADSFFILKSNLILFNTKVEADVSGKSYSQIIDSVKVAWKGYTTPEITFDTAVITSPSVAPKKKKSFFQRLGAAFSNKTDTTSSSHETVVINSRRKDSVIQHMQALLVESDSAQRAILGNVRNRVSYLSNITARLIIANTEITEKLRVLVNQLESISDYTSLQFKQIARDEYELHNAFMTFLSVSGLIFVILLSLLLIKYVNRMYNARRQLENENEAVNTLLVEKKDLLAIVSHEIRNPLNGVLGFMSALKNTGATERQLEMIEAAEMSGKTLLSTVNDLLDMSKLESGTFQINNHRFNPYKTIQQAVYTIRGDAEEKKLELSFLFSGNKEMKVTGDSFRLNQILINLISNAIKFTVRGTITINASLVSKESSTELSVSVTDTGMGMTAEQQAKLFTKYYRADSVNGISGAGLGLYICHKLIRLQKGNISVTSKLGKSTRFSFVIPYLPVGNDGAQNAIDEPVAGYGQLVFSGKRLLVVDDSLINLKLVEVMTKSWNMQVVLMNKSSAALDYISRNGIDIIITDLHMPEMDGLALIKALKSNPLTEQIPVLISSGETFTEKEMEELIKYGFVGSVAKPFTQSQLMHIIYNTLNTNQQPHEA